MNRRATAGFTLLEVVVALVILSMSLFVLVSAQSSSVFMTTDSQRILTGTWLAQQKMTEALLRIETEGVQVSDIEETGDFADFGGDGAFGEQVDFGDEYEDYAWAYTIRSIDLAVGDLAGNSDALEGAGLGPSEEQQNAAGGESRDLGDLGVQPDMISEMLKPYIREVRVLIWWGGDEPSESDPCEDCVEFVTHVANPSGTVVAGAEPETTE